jgi:hypothetical protein
MHINSIVAQRAENKHATQEMCNWLLLLALLPLLWLLLPDDFCPLCVGAAFWP